MTYETWIAKWERKFALARSDREVAAIMRAQNAEFNRIAATLEYAA